MSGRLRDLESRKNAIGQLETVLSAMRGIASMRMQQAIGALPGIRAYGETIAGALATLAAEDSNRPDPESTGGTGARRAGLIVLAAEHGFVGGYAERLIDSASSAMRRGDWVLIAGSRGVALATERGWHVGSMPMPSQPGAVGRAARLIAEQLFGALHDHGLQRIELIHGRLGPGYAQEVVTRSLLPLVRPQATEARRGPPPLLGLARDRLMERATQEYLLSAITEGCMESFAAENAARLTTMEAARSHLKDQLDSLESEARRLRQEETTGELMDVVAGWRSAALI